MSNQEKAYRAVLNTNIMLAREITNAIKDGRGKSAGKSWDDVRIQKDLESKLFRLLDDVKAYYQK